MDTQTRFYLAQVHSDGLGELAQRTRPHNQVTPTGVFAEAYGISPGAASLMYQRIGYSIPLTAEAYLLSKLGAPIERAVSEVSSRGVVSADVSELCKLSGELSHKLKIGELAALRLLIDMYHETGFNLPIVMGIAHHSNNRGAFDRARGAYGNLRDQFPVDNFARIFGEQPPLTDAQVDTLLYGKPIATSSDLGSMAITDLLEVRISN